MCAYSFDESERVRLKRRMIALLFARFPYSMPLQVLLSLDFFCSMLLCGRHLKGWHSVKQIICARALFVEWPFSRNSHLFTLVYSILFLSFDSRSAVGNDFHISSCALFFLARLACTAILFWKIRDGLSAYPTVHVVPTLR